MREVRAGEGGECGAPPWGGALPGSGFRRRFFVWSYVWLAYLVWPLSNLWSPGASSAHRLVGAAGLALFLAAYGWVFREPLEGLSRRALPAALLILVLGFGLTARWGPDWFGLLIFGATVSAFAQPHARAVALIGIMTAACLGALLWNGLSLPDALTLDLTCGLIGFAQLGLSYLVRALAALRAANAEIGRLAAVEERMRIARDVHDLLGHSLSVIALKADLAHRLLAAGEPDRAAAEMAEVQGVARRSLSEVRDAVAGYRRSDLHDELVRVREALEAAGVRCACAELPPDLPPAAGATLAWVVREAATNVVRHSSARSCAIRVERVGDGVAVSVEDDGRGPPGAVTGGHGLAGLAERVRAAGGELRTGRARLGGFRVEAWVPVPTAALPRPEAVRS